MHPPPLRTLHVQVYGDAYKGKVTKESGDEVEEDIYEAYNLSLVSAAGGAARGAHLRGRLLSTRPPLPAVPHGKKERDPRGPGRAHYEREVHGAQHAHGERAGGQDQGACPPSPPSPSLHSTGRRLIPVHPPSSQDADGNEAAHNVTIDEVHVLKKGPNSVFIGVKGGYFFAVKANETKDNLQTGPNALSALAIGFYWAVGPDV